MVIPLTTLTATEERPLHERHDQPQCKGAAPAEKYRQNIS